MKIQINRKNRQFSANLHQPLDISLPLRNGDANPTAWYCGPVSMEPVRANGFTGSVDEGGSVNFRDIRFNPHGHGTHTECLGHIAPGWISLWENLHQFHFLAQLVSLAPETRGSDQVVSLESLEAALSGKPVPEALVIRTLPNADSKRLHNYSNTNPPYLEETIGRYLAGLGVQHLLLDLPSVDREEDGGELRVHHDFWQFPENPRPEATITEFIFVPDSIADGLYLLNLQVAPFDNDAAPSRPVLFALEDLT